MGISRKLILEKSITKMIGEGIITRAGYGWVSGEVVDGFVILSYESLTVVPEHLEVVAAFCRHGSVERGGGKECCWNTSVEGESWSMCEVPGIKRPFCTCRCRKNKALFVVE